MTDLQKKKLASRRFWIVAWACGVLTFWVTVCILQEISVPWMGMLFPVIGGIPVSYITITSIKKKEGDK